MNYIYTPTPQQEAAQYTAGRINDALIEGKKVLWLLSGGSGIQVAVQAAKLLQQAPLHNLFVTLTDERFGPVGHANENWQQLLDAGFALSKAGLYRPLTGNDRTTTTAEFSSWLHNALTTCDYSIGIFGVGTDGHTAGIKPYVVNPELTDYATDFNGEDYERITITPAAIRRINEIVLQASGPDKLPVLATLLDQPLPPIAEFPAGILHAVQNVCIYTDNKKEDIL